MPILGKLHQRGFTLSQSTGDLNGHKSGPRASPMARIWHAPSYHIPKGFSMPRGTQFYLNSAAFECFGGGIKVHNPINREPCSSLKRP